MKRKGVITRVLAITLIASMVLAGCGTKNVATNSDAATDTAAKADTADAAAPAAVSHDETLTIELYDVAANYQGEQTGWYGKILKDKFNIVLNIIAPQVAGDPKSLYQTRCAAGNLGDIVILENADMLECVEAGLIQPIDITAYPNLMKYSEQINLFNADMGDGQSTYAIPTEMNTNGPSAYVPDTVYSYPTLPWDYYSEVGTPDLKNLDDLLACLKEIQDKHPTNEAGDKAYAISLWPDWDNTSIETVNQITKWYGQEVKDSILLGNDNTITPLTDKNGAYYKMLHFFYQANQMGLVDPDSATQDWNAACDKMKQKRVYLFWYNWQRGFYNTPERGAAGENYVAAPIADTNIYQESDKYYGSGRVWGVGSGVSEENKARIMEFLDWLASDEGASYQHAGTEGLIYTVNDDGTYTMTADGFNRFNSDIIVPDDMGGGKWSDGNNQVNQWIAAGVDTNSITGESYDSAYWSSTLEANQTKTTKEWSAKFGGAKTEVEYFKSSGLLTPVAYVNKTLAIDDSDTALTRGQCSDIVKNSSWKAIFAKDDADFDAIWDDMCTQLDGLGWQDLVKFDTEKYQTVVDARIEASK